MKGVKQVQNPIQLAHFFQKQWGIMIINIKRRFHQQPHDEFALCAHEEAGTVIFVHVYQSCDNRMKLWGSPDGKASDTDIIFIAVSMMSALPETGLHQLWIACG